MSEWQPMETAPRDGRECLVVTYGNEVLLASWTEEFQHWSINDMCTFNEYSMRAWMPLPDPPAPLSAPARPCGASR